MDTLDFGHNDPHALFASWLKEAESTEPNDPNAMCLATVDAGGRPSARMVLLKNHDERGFVWYTNMTSRKGKALAANPVAALCFYWKSTRKQIRIEGDIELVSPEEANAYFASRHRGSRIGAWASKQSQDLESPQALAAQVRSVEAEFENQEDIPRPDHWSGYRLIPETIEFWQDGEYRLHKRMLYTKTNQGWTQQWLFP